MINITKYNANSYLTLEGTRNFAEQVKARTQVNFSPENFTEIPSINGENSKVEYEKWVRCWKALYQELTERSRFLKRAQKKSFYEAQSKTISLPSFDQSVYKDGKWSYSYKSQIRESIKILRRTAQHLLNARKNAKILNRHYNVK